MLRPGIELKTVWVARKGVMARRQTGETKSQICTQKSAQELNIGQSNNRSRREVVVPRRVALNNNNNGKGAAKNILSFQAIHCSEYACIRHRSQTYLLRVTIRTFFCSLNSWSLLFGKIGEKDLEIWLCEIIERFGSLQYYESVKKSNDWWRFRGHQNV